jgi:hypothetical protein
MGDDGLNGGVPFLGSLSTVLQFKGVVVLKHKLL